MRQSNKKKKKQNTLFFNTNSAFKHYDPIFFNSFFQSESSFIMNNFMKSGRQRFHYDDDMIAAELKTKPFKHASGKR